MSDQDRTDGPSANPYVGLARVVAGSAFKTAGWAAVTYVTATRRVVVVAIHPDRAGELAEDMKVAVQSVTRSLLGQTLEERAREAADESRVAQTVAGAARPVAEAMAPITREFRSPVKVEKPVTLKDLGNELMRQSRDVRYEYVAHPAHARILGELAPDEARILTLLLKSGPQPAVDVRTGGPIGLVGSRLIAPGLNMIGARAGCRYVERVPAYLNNLFRLGLIWFSRETLREHLEYQVVEAQPDVLAAMHTVRQAKIVRRSIHLTPFGEDFCRQALGARPEELQDLPEHGDPDPANAASVPATD